jgi:hypothetical protein
MEVGGLADHAELMLQLVLGAFPRKVLRAAPAGGWGEQDQPIEPIRMRRGRHHRDEGGFESAHQDGSRRVRILHDHQHVLDEFLEGRGGVWWERSGAPHPSTIGQDESRERREAFQVPRVLR